GYRHLHRRRRIRRPDQPRHFAIRFAPATGGRPAHLHPRGGRGLPAAPASRLADGRGPASAGARQPQASHCMTPIQNFCKRYGAITAVEDVSFEVGEGQVCVLLGPSGCGKTTTLKMINRLIEPTSGRVRIAGRDTAELDSVTLRRSIGYVIQQVGLFPNMTVEDNICVVPNLLGWDKQKSRRRAAELLEIVALDPAMFLKRYPRELSGGQQQRVGVARALAADPPVMLMDEPFGAIDPINRDAIQDEFMRIQRQVRKTVLFVSHDIDEAVKMADCVALFRAGRIEQFGSPDDLLARPATDFVADFMGS